MGSSSVCSGVRETCAQYSHLIGERKRVSCVSKLRMRNRSNEYRKGLSAELWTILTPPDLIERLELDPASHAERAVLGAVEALDLHGFPAAGPPDGPGHGVWPVDPVDP